MSFRSFTARLRKGLKRRAYNLHPKAFFYEYYCKKSPDTPLMIRIDGDIKARIWPGDIIGRDLYLGNLFEVNEVRYVKKSLKPGMIFFDIGANMGYYTLIGAKLVGSSGQVHSFEPSPRMFQELRFNVELNNFNNVYLNNVALGNKPGLALLSRYDRGKEVFGSLSDRAFPGKTIVGYDEVGLETLDDYMVKNSIVRVDIIKMDVEGAELLVLKGAKSFLKQCAPKIIVFELADIHAAGFGYRCEEVLDLLRSMDYEIYTLQSAVRLEKIVSNPSKYPGEPNLIAISKS